MTLPDFRDTDIRDTDLSNLENQVEVVMERNTEGCTATQLQFDSTIIKKVSFSNMNLIDCDFSGIKFVECSFLGTDLGKCNCINAIFERCLFDNYTKASHNGFLEAKAIKTDFSPIDFGEYRALPPAPKGANVICFTKQNTTIPLVMRSVQKAGHTALIIVFSIGILGSSALLYSSVSQRIEKKKRLDSHVTQEHHVQDLERIQSSFRTVVAYWQHMYPAFPTPELKISNTSKGVEVKCSGGTIVYQSSYCSVDNIIAYFPDRTDTLARKELAQLFNQSLILAEVQITFDSDSYLLNKVA